MKKEIKTSGNSAAIVFNVEDMKVFGMKVGDFIEINITTAAELKARSLLGGTLEAGQSAKQERAEAMMFHEYQKRSIVKSREGEYYDWQSFTEELAKEKKEKKK